MNKTLNNPLGLRGSKRRVSVCFPPAAAREFLAWCHARGWTFSNGAAAAACHWLDHRGHCADCLARAQRQCVKRILSASWPVVAQERVFVSLRLAHPATGLSVVFLAAILAFRDASESQQFHAIAAANCFGDE